MYASVYPNIRTRQNEPFVYEVPIELMPYITPGSLVEVPFRNQKVFGLVAGLKKNYQLAKIRSQPKKINRVITNYAVLTKAQWQLANWLVDYYGVNKAQALFTIFPQLSIKTLQNSSPVICQTTIASSRKIKVLISPSQLERFGVYQQIVRQRANLPGQTVITVSDNDQLKTVASLFDRAIVYGNQLSLVQKTILWIELLSGQPKIIIGSRSSLFLPLPNLKLIIGDRPYHPGMFEQRSPKYSLWQIAIKMSELTGAHIVFGDEVPIPPVTRLENVKWRTRPISSVQLSAVKVPARQRILDAAKDAINDASRRGSVLAVLPRRGDIRGFKCHDCQSDFSVDKQQCPNCQSSHFRPFGYGLDTLAKMLANQSSSIKVDIVDQNHSYDRVGQIVIATQRIFDYEVSFRSGIIIGLDQYLSNPDPLTEESMYRLVKGVIHRSENRVDVLIRDPIDKFLSLLGDDQLAYQYFLTLRQSIHGYPYGHIIKLKSKRPLPEKLIDNIKQAPGVIGISDQHHPQFNHATWQVIITAHRSIKMSDIIQSTPSDDIAIDVDPLNLL